MDIYNKLDSLVNLAQKLGITSVDQVANTEYMINSLVKLVEKLKQNDLVKRYMSLSLVCANTGVKITEAWRAFGEQKFQALCIAEQSLPFEMYKTELSYDEEIKWRFLYSNMLLLCQTFAWKSEIIKLMKEYPVSPCVVSQEILPFPFTYHTFENALSVSRNDGIVDEGSWVDWLMFLHIPMKGFKIVHNISMNREISKMSIYESGVNYGMKYPEDVLDENDKKAVGMYLAMFAFLKSPYVSVDRQKIPRYMRRHSDDKVLETKEITVISLRKETRDSIASYEAESKTWKHKWWVRGHFRSQWYASTKSHEIIWIPPHLKGPEDLPLLEKLYSVNR